MAKTYTLECPENCSLGPNTQYGPLVSDAMVEGKTYRGIVKEVAALGGTIFVGTMSRHKKHIRITRSSDDVDADLQYKANNIEILETIIQKGFQNSKNWKPTIGDTMKALDMHFRLTQGNPFDELLDRLASAAIDEDVEEEAENPQAVRVVGEAPVPDFVDESEAEPVEQPV